MADGLDPELEALRAKRMAELQQQYGGEDSSKNREQQEAMKRQEAEMKNQMLSQILDQAARARLNSIALVKPEKARMVEGMLIQMASTGQLGGRINDAQFVSLLERFQGSSAKKSSVTFNRRRLDDSDEED